MFKVNGILDGNYADLASVGLVMQVPSAELNPDAKPMATATATPDTLGMFVMTINIAGTFNLVGETPEGKSVTLARGIEINQSTAKPAPGFPTDQTSIESMYLIDLGTITVQANGQSSSTNLKPDAVDDVYTMTGLVNDPDHKAAQMEVLGKDPLLRTPFKVHTFHGTRTFRVAGMPRGEYDLVISDKDGTVLSTTPITITDDDLVVPDINLNGFVTYYAVRVELINDPENPDPVVSIAVIPEGKSKPEKMVAVSESGVSIISLAIGIYDLKFTTATGNVVQTENVIVNEDRHIGLFDFRKPAQPAAYKVSGKVDDPDGQCLFVEVVQEGASLGTITVQKGGTYSYEFVVGIYAFNFLDSRKKTLISTTVEVKDGAVTVPTIKIPRSVDSAPPRESGTSLNWRVLAVAALFLIAVMGVAAFVSNQSNRPAPVQIVSAPAPITQAISNDQIAVLASQIGKQVDTTINKKLETFRKESEAETNRRFEAIETLAIEAKAAADKKNSDAPQIDMTMVASLADKVDDLTKRLDERQQQPTQAQPPVQTAMTEQPEMHMQFADDNTSPTILRSSTTTDMPVNTTTKYIVDDSDITGAVPSVGALQVERIVRIRLVRGDDKVLFESASGSFSESGLNSELMPADLNAILNRNISPQLLGNSGEIVEPNRAAELMGRINEQDGKISKIETDVSGIRNDVNTMVASVKDLTTTVNGIQGTVNGMQQTMTRQSTPTPTPTPICTPATAPNHKPTPTPARLQKTWK